MANLRSALLVLTFLPFLGCAPPLLERSPPGEAVLEVVNTSGDALTVGYCGVRSCAEDVRVEPRERHSFTIRTDELPRVVVTGMVGDRVVAQKAVDLEPGERRTVLLDALGPR